MGSAWTPTALATAHRSTSFILAVIGCLTSRFPPCFTALTRIAIAITGLPSLLVSPHQRLPLLLTLFPNCPDLLRRLQCSLGFCEQAEALDFPRFFIRLSMATSWPLLFPFFPESFWPRL